MPESSDGITRPSVERDPLISRQNRIDVRSPAGPGAPHRPIIRRLLKLVRHPQRIGHAIARRICGKQLSLDWQTLASDCGGYSVIDSRHPPEEFDYVTKRQKEILFPLLRQLLDGNERTILDFGSGPGRFTGDLAELTQTPVSGAWSIRTRAPLRSLFPSLRLAHVGTYYDAGQEISVLAGRKVAPATPAGRA